MPHGRVRACPDRRYKADGRLRESRGPDMPGPYRVALFVRRGGFHIRPQACAAAEGLRIATVGGGGACGPHRGGGCGIQTALKKIVAVEIVDA